MLRERLRQLASLLDEVLAQGGRVTAWFLSADRKRIAEQVREQAARVGDGELRAHAQAAADAWDSAFAYAPPERGLRVYSPNQPDAYKEADRGRGARMERVCGAAEAGKAAARRAVERLTELERQLPEP